MQQNLSPWLNQLKRIRPILQLQGDAESDVVIVGGGIAGIVTAYFTLRDTRKSVILLEASKVAHGATGHNAGQIVSYFEKPFKEIVKEYGLTLAAKAQDDIMSAWDLLEEVAREAKLQTPISQFTGYAGCGDLERLLLHLENKRLRKEAGLHIDSVLVAENAPFLQEISKKYKNLYAIVPQDKILALLETQNKKYFAALTSRKGCTNSALLTEEIAGYLLKTYPKRFRLVEHTPVKKIHLFQKEALLKIPNHTVKCKRVVLCTNGFENITIINESGPDIDHKFHELVNGLVGYMAGYLEPLGKPPTAISYFNTEPLSAKDLSNGDPYFYMTRRVFELEKNEKHNLVCMGGQEEILADKTEYVRDKLYPLEALQNIDENLHRNYQSAPKNIEYKYVWHGLMGYTTTGLRCIGPEPLNPVLLYNLGCNGIGILPSFFGGKRIARFLIHKKLEPSIFDPVDRRKTIDKPKTEEKEIVLTVYPLKKAEKKE